MRYSLERRDPEFETKMAEVLCVYREVAILKHTEATTQDAAAEVAIVFYDGKTVEYGSEADLIRRIRTIEGEMAMLGGNPKPRRSLASFRKG